MKQALPGGATMVKPPGANPTRIILIVIVLAIVIALVRSVFSHHESSYERTARELTTGLQNNDIAAVDKLQNSETRTHVTRAAVGHAADVFKPLDKLERVRQTGTPTGETHEFDATFAKGVVHETIRFDPDGKIVRFQYNRVDQAPPK
jgi:hypothetical protein